MQNFAWYSSLILGAQTSLPLEWVAIIKAVNVCLLHRKKKIPRLKQRSLINSRQYGASTRIVVIARTDDCWGESNAADASLSLPLPVLPPLFLPPSPSFSTLEMLGPRFNCLYLPQLHIWPSKFPNSTIFVIVHWLFALIVYIIV